ncbi:MAG: InlB B-repeat-containing protein, partial [Firmicutes bacterium]|nr:InlB B-repeat-containing protein [Bacillota bacterium]
TRTGYDFVSWKVEGNKLTAEWTAKTVTITLNDGNGNVETKVLNYGETFDLGTPAAKKGYAFVAWKDAKGNTIDSGTIKVSDYPNGAVFTAEWKTDGMSATAIALIAVGATLAVAAVAFCAIWFIMKKKKAGGAV